MFKLNIALLSNSFVDSCK